MKGYHFVPDMEFFYLVYNTLDVNPQAGDFLSFYHIFRRHLTWSS